MYLLGISAHTVILQHFLGIHSGIIINSKLLERHLVVTVCSVLIKKIETCFNTGFHNTEVTSECRNS